MFESVFPFSFTTPLNASRQRPSSRRRFSPLNRLYLVFLTLYSYQYPILLPGQGLALITPLLNPSTLVRLLTLGRSFALI